MSELYVCKNFETPYERVCKIITTLEEHDNQIRAEERTNIIEEVDLHLREVDYEYDSNMGIGDNIGSALLKEYANGYKKGEQDGKAEVRAKVLDEVKRLIHSRIIDNLALENATKYGNKNAKQQTNSYATVMKYEIADCVDDLLGDLEQLKEQK